MAKEVASTADKKTQVTSEITPERVREEIQRIRMEIAHDLKEYDLRYPKATEKTLSRVMTE